MVTAGEHPLPASAAREARSAPSAPSAETTAELLAVPVFFPMCLLLARRAGRRRWVQPVYTWACGPMMVVLVIAFVTGTWAD